MRIAGIDIGGTSIKAGVFDGNGTLLEKREIPTEAKQGGKALLEKIAALIGELDVEGAGISTCGVVKDGTILACNAIPDYAGRNVKKDLEQMTGLPVEVENDVNCAALAELYAGAAKGSDNVLVLTIGTGIGGCAIVDGKVLAGHHSAAAEVGQMPWEDSIWERKASASFLTEKTGLSGREVFEKAKAGNGACREAVNELCYHLGRGLGTLCAVLDPEVIVLGGGIMAQEEVLRPKIEGALKANCLPLFLEGLQLKFAQMGNEAGMAGAFWNWKTKSGATR